MQDRSGNQVLQHQQFREVQIRAFGRVPYDSMVQVSAAGLCTGRYLMFTTGAVNHNVTYGAPLAVKSFLLKVILKALW